MLDFSLISLETSTQNFNHVNFIELINDTIEYCQKAFSQSQNLEIVFYTNDINEAIINGNSHRIRQVITNLLVNAIKYGDGGLISINLELTNQSKISYWQLSVSDQGIGLSEDEMESIFKPFFRSSKCKLIPGHGIGLAICQKIADNHGSQLNAVNNNDKGSTFYFSIPAVLMG